MMKLVENLFIFIAFITITEAVNCPDNCRCKWILDSLKVDCSELGLSILPDFGDLPIEVLDLSNNAFTEFPSELARVETLTNLDLTRNYITNLEHFALENFTSLSILLLNDNKITNCRDINPNSVLLPAIHLSVLSLRGNPIISCSSSSDDLFISRSLKLLDLSHCKITKIFGRLLFQGLTNLERLILNGNPLKVVTQFESNSLQFLELNNCNLVKLSPHTFDNFTNLIYLSLSGNSGLQLQTKPGEFVKSDSLKHLDLSFCNMDSIDVLGFPNLTFLTLKGNMVRKLTRTTFENNRLLESLDVSNNAIDEIEAGTFNSLKVLRRLDLSFNALPGIDRNTFIDNEHLTVLNLGRNFITKFKKLVVPSLSRLNLSGCEILTVDQNALTGLPNIVELDLSNNLLSHFPDMMKSETLSNLDLSMCRLTSIRNRTFAFFPELTTVNLSGNRLTTPPKISTFKGNPFLFQLWLGDNPWRCDCQDSDFMKFYLFVSQRPSKLNDKIQVRCASPDNLYGRSWENACFQYWFQGHKISSTEKVWSGIMVTIIVLSVVLCIYITLKRYCEGKKRRENERQLLQNIEENREIMRQNRMMMEQEAQLNAPDPRETLPPCYEDALLLPKLERNFKSMDELSSRRSKRAAGNSKHIANEDLILDYKHFQSEEMLSVRDKERTFDINSNRRTGRIERTRSGTRLFAAEDSRFPAAYVKTQNLESAEHIANFQSYENSPYSKRQPKIKELDQVSLSSSNSGNKIAGLRKSIKLTDSVEIIASYESIPKSPYARRAPKIHTEGTYESIKKSPYARRQPRSPLAGRSISQWTISSSSDKNEFRDSDINLVEGYYSKPQSARGSFNDFQVIASNDRDFQDAGNDSREYVDDPIVIVQRQQNLNESQI